MAHSNRSCGQRGSRAQTVLMHNGLAMPAHELAQERFGLAHPGDPQGVLWNAATPQVE
jgi:hypothetical protein